jgi:hypothetical protein
MDSVILVHESLPEEVAAKVTRTLIRNKGQRMVTIHASMGAWDPATSWKYQGVPLHPGAAKAFRGSRRDAGLRHAGRRPPPRARHRLAAQDPGFAPRRRTQASSRGARSSRPPGGARPTRGPATDRLQDLRCATWPCP